MKKAVKAKPVAPKRSKAVEQAEATLATLKAGKSCSVPPVKVVPDHPDFVPLSEDRLTWVFANVASNLQGSRVIQLTHRSSQSVDCGFIAKVPEGYHLVFDLSPDFKEKGLEIYKNTVVGESRVSLGVRNLGREIIVIRDRERVATVRIEPLYELNFEVVSA